MSISALLPSALLPVAKEPTQISVTPQTQTVIKSDEGKNDAAKLSYQKTATEKFLELMDMSIEERYFELYLKKEGLTKEEFEALPPEEQEKIVEKFEQELRKDIEGGMFNTANIPGLFA